MAPAAIVENGWIISGRRAMSTIDTTQAHQQEIWRIVFSIPSGRVTSYGAIAKLAGLPRGARLVGRVLAQLPEGSALPWHRVVNSRGTISFPSGSARYREQRERLLTEGVEFRNEKIDWSQFGWP
jgi:methylated-DNA-protein-cysteine methyltransferase-like protein